MMPENKKSRKPRKIKAFGVVCGVPARIRTGGVPLRRRTLYPAEVQRHLAICGYFYSTHLPPFCERREVEQTLRRRTLYPAELPAHTLYPPGAKPPARNQPLYFILLRSFCQYPRRKFVDYLAYNVGGSALFVEKEVLISIWQCDKIC